MLAKQIDIGEGALCLQLCENNEQLAPNMPDWLFALISVKAQARQRHDLHEVLQQTFRNVAPRGEVQAVVLDERHCVLISKQLFPGRERSTASGNK